MNAALLIARLIVGLGIAVHGSQKLFGWFGGGGPQGTGQFMESLGYRPGTVFAIAAGLGETLGGLLLTLGFLGGIGPALVIVVMLVAIYTVHLGKGFLSQNGGWEMPALYIAGALALDFSGFGKYALDSILHPYALTDYHARWIMIGIAIVLAIINIALRRSHRPGRAPA